MASREALQKLIQFGNAEQFATHAEDWSACSSAAILNAAVEQLGKLPPATSAASGISSPTATLDGALTAPSADDPPASESR